MGGPSGPPILLYGLFRLSREELLRGPVSDGRAAANLDSTWCAAAGLSVFLQCDSHDGQYAAPFARAAIT
jgi:hypothetical protein